ncbi:MAG: succinate dehydrogenase assembly factor 2 [Paracoccaceae bacterium]|nr:succinate dehydrogenase assembly factor 2 [Paracoccaceae bacterium]
MTEDRETRLKRLRIRSWRRGTREMDLILGPFADTRLAELNEAALDAYEQLLEENDWDIYYWITGARPVPEAHAGLVDILRIEAGAV